MTVLYFVGLLSTYPLGWQAHVRTGIIRHFSSRLNGNVNHSLALPKEAKKNTSSLSDSQNHDKEQ